MPRRRSNNKQDAEDMLSSPQEIKRHLQEYIFRRYDQSSNRINQFKYKFSKEGKGHCNRDDHKLS